LDWFRLSGNTKFEGFYMMVYTLTTVMLLIGGRLVAVLATALRTSRLLTTQLDTKVNERTAELEAANTQLIEMSRTDSLTGLANRRRFDEMLKQEWERAQRSLSPLSLLTIDIDWFKNFNDHYGHPAGDECLRAVSNLLSQHVQRGTDLLARTGGEEFSVISSTNLAGALHLAEKLRSSIFQSRMIHNDSPLGYVSISVGVTELKLDTDATIGDFCNRADQALYRAKAGGRNRTEK
jgi:diguanylate cyclase (GGDEF)-like protein